jgi:DNA excision repair protein ERCC-8
MVSNGIPKRTTAFEYVYERSFGIRNDFQDNLYAEASSKLEAVGKNFIYNADMKVWTMALDPIAQQYLLVGSSDSNVYLYDLNMIDEASASLDSTSSRYSGGSYDTSNPIPPVCSVRARSTSTKRQRTSSSSSHIAPEARGNYGLQYGISQVDWYPVDGGIFVTSSLDEHVKLWDANTFEMVSDFELGSKVFCAKFSPIALSHALIAASTGGGEIRLCDMSIEASTHTLFGHTDEVWTLAWSLENEFHLASACRGGEVRMWDIRRSGATACLFCLNKDGKASQPTRINTTYTNPMKHQSTKLNHHARVSNHKDRHGRGAQADLMERRIFDRNQRDMERRKRSNESNDPHIAASTSSVKAHTGSITSLAFTPDGGRFLVSSGNDDKIRLWNAKTGEHLFVNYLHAKSASLRRGMTMAFAQEQDAFSTILYHPNGPNGNICSYFVHTQDGNPCTRFTAHYGTVTSCVYRKSHHEMYSGGEDGLIMCWIPPSSCMKIISDHQEQDSRYNNCDIHTSANGYRYRLDGVSDEEKQEDQDAWSDDTDPEDMNDANRFIPPILRQE